MTKLGAERHSVQNPLVRYACEIGWEYISPDEALRLRGGETGLVLKEVFTDRMARLNSRFIDSAMIEDLIKRLEMLPARIEGNLQAWEYLKGIKTVFVPEENRERNVRFIDENPEKNVFHITDEFAFTNGTHTNRYDVVFLINGIPLFFVETKAVAKFMNLQVNKESIIAEALEQIRRYHTETPEAMTLFQLYAVTNIVHFLYSSTWSLSAKSIFNWKLESGAGRYEELVKTFFDRRQLIKTLLEYILFTRQDDELKKVILRPHQMRAVNKLLERAKDSKKTRGLIWHTQGSGKTYTMIVAAEKILKNPLFNNPTVIMLVDRNELESQLFGNLSSCGIEHVEVARSKKHLRELLAEGRRGLIVSMIHKFEGMPANIDKRKNIFVLIDEAHRTTGGDLGNYLMGALPNATYIGLTGTPIDRTSHGRGTFVIFGRDDPPLGYLDKYGIAESIEDGATVKLHYTLAPNELQVDRELLEKEFLDLAEAQGISDVEALNKVLEKAVNLKNMLKNKERVESLAKFVADHYRLYVEPMGYKAFLVAVDREACALYKEELDRHLPSDYSAVVFSPGHNDTPELRKYHLSQEEEKRVRKDFRNPQKVPKILIVTEKLLTGFDAPILYCMYLDKPMRDHVLLQAIARVNRPYEDETGRKKPCGFVLDFVGIFGRLEKALAFDSGDVAGVVKDIEVLKERFSEMMGDARKNYLRLIEGRSQDKTVEAVLQHFLDEEKRHEFYEFFKELSDIYEILSPDAFLRPYLEDFDTLARMYKIVKESYEPGILVDREFARKTARLVQEHTKSSRIKDTLDVYEINEEILDKLEKEAISDTEKIFNLLRSIGIEVERGLTANPYLYSIGEKAEMISLLFKQRQKNTKETLEELKKLIEEINRAKKEKAEKGMSPEVFSTYWILKEEDVPYSEDKAKDIGLIIEKYPYWRASNDFERRFKQEVIKILTGSGISAKRAVQLANKLITILKGVKE